MTNNYIADQNGFRSSLAPSNGPLLPLVGKAPKVAVTSVSHAPVASKSNSQMLCIYNSNNIIVITVAAAPVQVAAVPVAAAPTVKGK